MLKSARRAAKVNAVHRVCIAPCVCAELSYTVQNRHLLIDGAASRLRPAKVEAFKSNRLYSRPAVQPASRLEHLLAVREPTIKPQAGALSMSLGRPPKTMQYAAMWHKHSLHMQGTTLAIAAKS